jgi:ATP-dependent Zn protease
VIDERRVAYHEAGHVAAARLLGVEVKAAAIVPDGGIPGHVKYVTPQTSEPVSLERVAMIALAGCAAERRYLGAAADDHEPWHRALEDMQLASTSVEALVGSDDEEVVGARLEQLGLQVAALLEQHWSAVERVAARLIERKTLSSAEIDECIGTPAL